jgi:hypothetical protein
MRLSIAIVFLIGAMVATEVICDAEAHIARGRAWFEKTVDRLESGQTVTQNRRFIMLVFDYTDQLLAMVSCAPRVNRTTIGQNTHNPDGELIGRIENIQTVLRNRRPPTRPGIHVNLFLSTLKNVLRRDFLSARFFINKSKPNLPHSLTRAEEHGLNRVEAQTLDPLVGSPSVLTPGRVRAVRLPKISYVIRHILGQTAQFENG